MLEIEDDKTHNDLFCKSCKYGCEETAISWNKCLRCYSNKKWRPRDKMNFKNSDSNIIKLNPIYNIGDKKLSIDTKGKKLYICEGLKVKDIFDYREMAKCIINFKKISDTNIDLEKLITKSIEYGEKKNVK